MSGRTPNSGKGQSGFNKGYSNFGTTENTTTMNDERYSATKGFVDKTIDEYDRLFRTVKDQHKKFLGSPNTKDEDTIIGSELIAVDRIKSAYKEMWEEIEKTRNNAVGNITSISTSNASVVTANTSNIEKILKNIADSLSSGATTTGEQGRAGRNRLNDSDQQSDLQKSFVKVSDKVLDITELMSHTLIQGRESQRIVGFGIKSLESIVSLVANFRDQEKLADSLVGILVMIVKEVLGFISDAMMDHYNTQEEIFTNYMIYMRGTDRNFGYLIEERRFGNELAELNLENNIRITDLMRKSVDLASKGLSADQARNASLSNAIYGIIAPNLNTTSDIFLDLQTRGLKNITDGLSGIVESVRSTAGSSRIAMTAMNTIVDKLGPIELYAQKGLLSGDASQMLADLEQMGYTTADAMEIVNTVVDAYNDPYKALSSGSVMAKIVAEQYASQNIDTLTEGKDLVLQMLDTYTSGLDLEDIVSRSAVYSAVGLNINPRFRQTTEGEPEDLVETPEDAYNRLLEQLGKDEYQTFNELQTIAVTNTEMAMGFNTFVREIGDKLTIVTDAVCDIADFLVGSDTRNIDKAYELAVATAKEDKSTTGQMKALAQLSEAIVAEYDSAYTSKDRKAELEAQYAQIQEEYAKRKSWLSPQDLSTVEKLASLPTSEKVNWGTPTASGGSMVGVRDAGRLPSPMANGAYVTTATPAIVGEAGPEFVIPEQKLIDTIGKGINQYIIANNPTPDYSVIVSAIYNVASEMIDAINNKNSNIKLDTSTGLMSGNLNPTMGGH